MECARCDYYKVHNCKHQCMQLPKGKTCAGGSRLDLRKSRVLGTIGRKKDAKNGVDCHSVNLRISGRTGERDYDEKDIRITSRDRNHCV